MTATDIEAAFDAAVSDLDASLAIMRPYRNKDEGYCEANLVEYYSHALRQLGFRPFLELPIPRGRVDGLFFRDSTFLLVEAKQLYRESVAYIRADLERLSQLHLQSLLQSYGLTIPITEVFEIVLCDCWSVEEARQWPKHPFLNGYTTRVTPTKNGHLKWPYSLLLAYRKSPTTKRRASRTGDQL